MYNNNNTLVFVDEDDDIVVKRPSKNRKRLLSDTDEEVEYIPLVNDKLVRSFINFEASVKRNLESDEDDERLESTPLQPLYNKVTYGKDEQNDYEDDYYEDEDYEDENEDDDADVKSPLVPSFENKENQRPKKEDQ